MRTKVPLAIASATMISISVNPLSIRVLVVNFVHQTSHDHRHAIAGRVSESDARFAQHASRSQQYCPQRAFLEDSTASDPPLPENLLPRKNPVRASLHEERVRRF